MPVFVNVSMIVLMNVREWMLVSWLCRDVHAKWHYGSFSSVAVLHVPIMAHAALKHHLIPSSETLSPRESREHQPQGLHDGRDGSASELCDLEANKKPLICDSNAVTARPGDACETGLSG